ncbi:hypothetical protein ACA910_017341 [Epithemia clementina (nom. ined.)]
MSTQTQIFPHISFGKVPNLLDSQDNDEETVVSERSAITVKASNVNSDRLNTKQTMSGMKFDNVELWVSSLDIVKINAFLGIYYGLGAEPLAFNVQLYVPSFQSQSSSIQQVVTALEFRQQLLGNGREARRVPLPGDFISMKETGSDLSSLGQNSTGNNDGGSSAGSSRCIGGEKADAVIALASLENPLPAAVAAAAVDDEVSTDVSSQNKNHDHLKDDQESG